jgi:hypothetical protein
MKIKSCTRCGKPKPGIGLLCRQCWRAAIAATPKKCTVPECSNQAATANLCNAHYLRLRRYGSTDPHVKKRKASKRTNAACKVDGCEKPVKSSGYCHGHYHRVLRYKDPTFKPREAKLKPCVQPNCNGLTASDHGFCKRHRRKVYAAKEYGSKQRLARLSAWYAERKGLLVRPAHCKCGSSKRIEAHHEDYDKPLEVIYLCKKCHVAVHKSKKFGRDPSPYAILNHH